MNRIKSKENLNPNTHGLAKKEDQDGVRTRNQSRPLFKQHPNNPEKSTKKNHFKKHDDPKPHPQQPTKPSCKPPILPAQLHYQQQILSHITSSSQNNFKKYKQLEQNKLYRAYRQRLIQSIYIECINFELKPQTFYLYVYYLDSFMKTEEGRKLTMNNTVMASYACFLMAQKYQEIYPPSIKDWLPEHVHDKVYKWQGKIIFALNFRFIHESIQHFFQYWSRKFQLKLQEKESCMILLESIVFNFELMYKYEPQKIAKAVVLMEVGVRSKKGKSLVDKGEVFQSNYEKNKVMGDISKHLNQAGKRLEWMADIRKKKE